MIKRVNFTGRKRIPRSRVEIQVYDGTPRRFDASIDLAGITLLPDASVVLEATCARSTVVQRYEFGTVAHIHPQSDRNLQGLDGDKIFFTLKVIDRGERIGRILGLAEQLRPERAGSPSEPGRQSILAVDEVELGQEVWQLDFDGPDVVLLVNKNIAGIKDHVRHPAFSALVYPSIVRRILARAIDELEEDEEESGCWPALWLRYAQSLHPTKQKPPIGDDSQEETENWIEDVVTEFCIAHQLGDKYAAVLQSEAGGEG